MSDSRLEKFIYVICSMNVSDLPVPLSRIEKLWNCLITEEAPDFEPLSRNEKYLMAMLDRYDISNLPAPMSRGEKLLYKIAVGETDLSDVSGYLSRYEELLKYLIENGGISGGDFEYVLYTLNQSVYTLYTTAEKPVKTAILKGNTLVNIVNYSETFVNTSGKYLQISSLVYSPIGKQITLINFSDKMITFQVTENGAFKKTVSINANSKTVITLSDGEEIKNIRGSQSNGWEINETSLNELKLGIMVIDGDYTNVDIPYFTGMQSVKMPVLTTTGKNLIGNLVYGTLNSNGVILDDKGQKRVRTDYIPISSTGAYRLSNHSDEIGITIIFTFDENKNLIKNRGWNASHFNSQHTFSNEEKYIIIEMVHDLSNQIDIDLSKIKIQFEQNIQVTTYEPFKSNILTVNEDVTLRSNGDICDELNLLTGQLTQRIGEDGVVLSQEVVKTVDLSVVNQDNQPTQLGTFENVTHVSLEAENLIPEVEMEVATRISEELASASLLMDDISTKQEQLNTTVDEQSENVDATMIATTEIFEETL